jgi:hypothetical protein
MSIRQGLFCHQDKRIENVLPERRILTQRAQRGGRGHRGRIKGLCGNFLEKGAFAGGRKGGIRWGGEVSGGQCDGNNGKHNHPDSGDKVDGDDHGPAASEEGKQVYQADFIVFGIFVH